ncbi:UPF0052-domain-containing protein [Aaosphaeria arxii CBS 175.79]|uniref:UPF0052-domain-containing protein n=1 Tax=Aaosphaeria arxii CBS 175.79 TaxID=1450172 RepID=A0A6A5XEI2_9PLEO|nr:UPF0052-domain-containing protein [Aaosphaeria arxii CBS 175.79]KAF2011289.1 UPF0052-domain-containing protein [Aaosphaeria arxii CBS 175.79]
MSSPPGAQGIVVFSGGSAANNLVDVFKTVRENKKCPLSYVIPISDNGGSSSELIRVFGGPGIGDVRSRLVRLIPDDPDHDDSEKAAIKVFFNHRLPKDRLAAKQEWLQIIEADHALWANISTAKKELIRSILNVVNYEILQRLRPSSAFDFSSASIGNLFLTGARLFTNSLESAIYLLSSICSVPSHTSVLPAISSNFTHHIRAGLADSTFITGQNAISHPSHPSHLEYPSTTSSPPTSTSTSETEYHDTIEDANPPGSLPTLRKPYLTFSKTPPTPTSDDLPARITRIWYINPYGQEIRLAANPRVLSALSSAQAVVYSIGSLYTSIVPSLILRGVGAALASPRIRCKILVLNSTVDRETGPSSRPFRAIDFVGAVANAAAQSQSVGGGAEGGKELGREEYGRYVTHVIHLAGEGTPEVDRGELQGLGIECLRVYGRRVEGEGWVRYDEKALVQALEVTMGRRERGMERLRRNTLEG